VVLRVQAELAVIVWQRSAIMVTVPEINGLRGQ